MVRFKWVGLTTEPAAAQNYSAVPLVPEVLKQVSPTDAMQRNVEQLGCPSDNIDMMSEKH